MPEEDSDGIDGAELTRPGAERPVVVFAQHGLRRAQDPPLLWRVWQLHREAHAQLAMILERQMRREMHCHATGATAAGTERLGNGFVHCSRCPPQIPPRPYRVRPESGKGSAICRWT